MSTVIDREPELRQVRRQLRRFDSISSLIQAFMTLTGIVVAGLIAIWLAQQVWPARGPTRAMELLQIASGDEEGLAGDNPELGENSLPSNESLPQRDESLEFEDTEIAETLTSVLDAISPNEIDLSPQNQQEGPTSSGQAGLAGGEGKSGSGKGRGGIPNYARWDIRYPTQSLTDYAAMLDAFGIELGVVRGESLSLVSQLSRGQPVVQAQAGGADRLYFQWQDPSRRKADIDLLRQKGVAVNNAVIVQFVPGDLEATLAALERKEAKQPVEQIRKTRFGVRSKGKNDFEFYVIDITYIRS